MEVAVYPIAGVSFLDVEVGFEGIAGSLAAEENPLGVDGAGHDAGGLFARRLVLSERVFEESEK